MNADALWPWLPLAGEIHVVTAVSVWLHVLRHKREANSSLLWIFIAWALPILGPLTYLMFGVDRVTPKGGHRRNAHARFVSERLAREEAELPMAYWKSVRDAVTSEPSSSFARELNRSMNAILPDFPLLGGNRVDLLVTGDEAYPAMRKAIRSARHHIHLQTFILGRDRTGRAFLDLLAARAAEGIAVRVLFDRFGSTHAFLSGMIAKYRGRSPNLRIAGWTQANPLKRQFQVNLRNHRKMLIVDGQTAITGGINLQDANVTAPGFAAHRDYDVRIRGPAVQELQLSFLSDWHYMTDENPEVLLHPDLFPAQGPTGGRALVRVVNGGPAGEIETLTDVFFNGLVAARREILAVTPYFVPTADILRAFRSAALRGVNVRLVVPARNNHVYAGLAGRSFYQHLLDAGVRIFERQPPFMHAKALVVDGEMAFIGTANLDARSLRLNYETNLVIYDEPFVSRLKQAADDEIACSREILPEAWRRRPVYGRLLENACALMTPIL